VVNAPPSDIQPINEANPGPNAMERLPVRVPSNKITVTSPPAEGKPFSFMADLFVSPVVENVSNKDDENWTEISQNLSAELVILPDEGHYLDDVLLTVAPSLGLPTMAMVRLITPNGPVEIMPTLADPEVLALSKYGPVKGIVIRVISLYPISPDWRGSIPLATVTITGKEKKGLGTVEVSGKTTQETVGVSPPVWSEPIEVVKR